MSERYVWKEAFSLGIPELDAEHRAFFDLINAVSEAVDRGDGEAVQSALSGLRTYADIHFAHEEQFLKAAACPELPRQQAEHAEYVRQLVELQRGGDCCSQAGLEFARSWLIDHILDSDKRCTAWLRETDVRMPYPVAS